MKRASRFQVGTRRRANALEWAWDYFNGELIRLSQHIPALVVGVVSFYVRTTPQQQQHVTDAQKVFATAVIGTLFWMNLGTGINTIRAVRGFYRRRRLLEPRVKKESIPVGNTNVQRDTGAGKSS